MDLCAVADGTLDGYIDCLHDARRKLGLPRRPPRLRRGRCAFCRRPGARARRTRSLRAPHSRGCGQRSAARRAPRRQGELAPVASVTDVHQRRGALSQRGPAGPAGLACPAPPAPLADAARPAADAADPPATTPPDPPPTPQLSLLLELQEADLALDRLAYRRRELAERVAVSELGGEHAELAARVAEAREQRDKLASQQVTLDQRSEAVGGRIAAIEQRLRSGRAGSYRDEQAMGEEVASLAHLRREIEDQELEVMEALEPLDQELAVLTASSARPPRSWLSPGSNSA